MKRGSPSGCPVWALAALAAQSASVCGWPSRFSDDGEIGLRGLAIHGLEGVGQAATESLIPAERARQMIEIGVMPLAGSIGKDAAFMPLETTVAGESLSFQLFLSRVIAFLLGQRSACDADSNGTDPEDFVYRSLKALLESSGHRSPADLTVRTGVAEDDDGAIPLEIAFTPAKSILPAPRQIAFTFSW